jgi:nitronate monooxygenase
MTPPLIIQGGMGIAVSNWRLARAVSLQGEMGVVSGTALDMVLSRRLQLGDPEGDARRALEHFPDRGLAERVVEAHFIPGGRAPGDPFFLNPLPSLRPGPASTELTVAANFVEVYLAKEGHHGVVGINLLEKIQMPTLASLYGAMLAGVDYVLMGAGIPRSVPGVLDRLAAGLPAELRVDVAGALPGEAFTSALDPRTIVSPAPLLGRPRFLAIVSSAALAVTLARKSNGRVDGFVVEGDLAGGHNAPPRGPMQLDPGGQPVYGPRDAPDLEKIRELGLPFWLAGSYARPEKVETALRLGACGVQVGTAFAFCAESGIDDDLKREAIRESLAGKARVFTDPVASPTGFPFKVVGLAGTLSESGVYADRRRICDLGYLRQPYRKGDGGVGYRCPGEPVEDYVRKGGAFADTAGRKCLCNGLAATVGLAQVRGDGPEPALVTAGNELEDIVRLVPPGGGSYSAGDVVRYLRGAAA